MKRMRLFALLLAVLTLISLLGSCGNAETPSEQTTAVVNPSAGTTADTAETQAETELNALNRLGSRDLQKETVTFYSRSYNGDWTSDLLYTEITGETIKDAIATRNTRIMSQYNVTLAERKSGAQSFYKDAETELAAGNPDFDVMYMSMRDAAQMSVDGYLREIGSIPNIQTEEAWWSPFLTSQLSICNKSFYITGEITTIDDISIRAVFYNKDMLNDIDSSINLYDKVEADEWNLEYMFTLVNTAFIDVGTDGKVEIGKDTIGLLAEGTYPYQLLMGTGEKIVSKDESDSPYFSIGDSRPLDILGYISDKVSNNLAVQVNSTVYKPFTEGKILFALVTIARENDMKGYDINFGLIPYPKYNKDQKEYHCYSDAYCPNAICFPKAVSDSRTELAAYVCESLAIESVNTVTPQFYDVCMKMKNARDERMGDMLDLIRNDYMIDLADVFMSAWNLRTPVVNAITSGQSMSSTIATLKKSSRNIIGKTVEKINAAG